MSTDPTSAPIDRCLEQWHQNLRGQLPGGLDALLDDHVVFWSPVVFTAIEGKELTKLYLTAAGNTFGGEPGTTDAGSPSGEPSPPGSGTFRYVRTVCQDNHACLEFETTMDGKYVNGVDLITCNDEGRIVEFKVMIRPLQAINAVHAQMRAMIETMSAPG